MSTQAELATMHVPLVEAEPIVPSHLGAERSILGAIVECGELLPQTIDAELQVEDFLLSDHQRVYAAMLGLHRRRCPIDYITVGEALGNTEDVAVLLGSLIQGIVIEQNHILYHVEILRKKSRLRSLLKLSEWLAQSVTQTADPYLIAAEAIAKLERLAPSAVLA